MCESYIIYQSLNAAENMFTVMKLVPEKIRMDGTRFIGNDTAKVNLDMALILTAQKNGPYQ